MHDPFRESFQDQHCFSPPALANCGFELSRKAKFPSQIYQIRPSGGKTCVFDALITSISHLRQLHLMIGESGRARSWKLCHIVFVTAADWTSLSTWQECLKAQAQLKSKLQVFEFTTIFITYNVSSIEYQQMLFLTELDPQTTRVFPASFFHSDNQQLNLGLLMKKIRKDIGLLFKQNLDSRIKLAPEDNALMSNPYGETELKFSYAVLFSIAEKAEFAGQVWSSICNNVNNFARYLGDRDLVGCCLYGEKPRYFSGGEWISKKGKKLLDAEEKEKEEKVRREKEEKERLERQKRETEQRERKKIEERERREKEDRERRDRERLQILQREKRLKQEELRNALLAQAIVDQENAVRQQQLQNSKKYAAPRPINHSEKTNYVRLDSRIQDRRCFSLGQARTCRSKCCICIIFLLTIALLGGIAFIFLH